MLRTARLSVRPFRADDLTAVHEVLDRPLPGAAVARESTSLETRRAWLTWTILNYEQLHLLRQPPYGDRAIELSTTGQMIGACGLVPCLGEFSRIPGLGPTGEGATPGFTTAEMGIFYAISTAFRRRGYASEAARALVDFCFGSLRVRRVIATTEYDNVASIGVMRRIGMGLASNPTPDPPWLQVVGQLVHPEFPAGAAIVTKFTCHQSSSQKEKG